MFFSIDGNYFFFNPT